MYRERPILFSGPMVRALLDGSKTQTRRTLKEKHLAFMDGVTTGRCVGPFVDICPYGQPGDRLWVRESWQPLLADGVSFIDADFKIGKGYAPGYPATDDIVQYYDSATDNPFCSKIIPSIFMRRWASRITLEITDVRVQRLKQISEADAFAEGIDTEGEAYNLAEHHMLAGINVYGGPATHAYADLWDSINGPGAWALNPWVWAITFKRIKP